MASPMWIWLFMVVSHFPGQQLKMPMSLKFKQIFVMMTLDATTSKGNDMRNASSYGKDMAPTRRHESYMLELPRDGQDPWH